MYFKIDKVPLSQKFAKMSYLPLKFGQNAKNGKKMQKPWGGVEPAKFWIGCRALDHSATLQCCKIMLYPYGVIKVIYF